MNFEYFFADGQVVVGEPSISSVNMPQPRNGYCCSNKMIPAASGTESEDIYNEVEL